jgi:hypothetical protein
MLHPGPAVASSGSTLDPPANLRVTALQPVRVTIAWDPVPNARTYVVSVTLAAETTARFTQGTTTALDVMWNKTYDVSVRALVGQTETPPSDPITFTTPFPTDLDLPSPPTNLRVERNAQGEITLIRWDAVAGDFGPLAYLLFIDTPVVPGWGDLSGQWATGGLTADPGTTLVGAHIHLPGQSITLWVMAQDRQGRQSLSDPLVLTCCPF